MSRSGLYYQPLGESAENLKLMRMIDEEYTRRPFYGSRKLRLWLHDQGYGVGRHRVRRLMGLIEPLKCQFTQRGLGGHAGKRRLSDALPAQQQPR